MADWTKIKTEYISENTSYRKLAKKHGISYQAICRRSKEEGWIEQRERHMNKAVTKSLDKICNKQVDRAARLSDVAEKLLEKVAALLADDGDLTLDTQAMKHISGVLKDIKEVQMVRSEADLREQEARIAKLQREAEREEDDKDRKVIVTIAGGDESWRK